MMSKRRNKNTSAPKNNECPAYIVEKVVKKRIHEGKIQYFLKWQGFSE